MRIAIYQIDIKSMNTDEMFRKAFKDFNESVFDFSDYSKVYEYLEFNEFDDTPNLLEYLFEKFNLDHPKDYKAHSLSVGDIVCINDEDYYYCNGIGWKNINKYIK